MRNKVGITCMILGAALVVAALSLFLWNQRENQVAGETVDNVLPQLIAQIEAVVANETSADAPTAEQNPAENTERNAELTVSEAEEEVDTSMTEVFIDGYGYIGYLSIPSLGLELPVMSDWDETRLKISVCRYSGSTKSDDLVIAGHNYTRLFYPIKNLVEGDEVLFTDMDGVVHDYEVVVVEMLNPTAIEEMTAGTYDLTLFTCTYSGQSRVTVRCERVEQES